MEVFNNRVCLTAMEVALLMSDSCRKQLVHRGQLIVARRGCKGREALYEAKSMPAEYYRRAVELFPAIEDMQKVRQQKTGGQLVEAVRRQHSGEAWQFFTNYVTADRRHLSDERIEEYTNNAIIMDAILDIYQQNTTQRMRQGLQPVTKKELYERVVMAMGEVTPEYRNSLPQNPRSLQRKVELYQRDGLRSIITDLMGNKNGALVNTDMESIVLSLYAMKQKPYASDVVKMFYKWATGKLTLTDRTTGEIISPQAAWKTDRQGNRKVMLLSETTVRRIIADNKNRAVVDQKRNDGLYNKKTHTPYVMRTSPIYSLSKISMDDRDLTRKMPNGDKVCAYYAYDVASGCVIGASYSKVKDIELVYDCFRNMLQNLVAMGMGCPLEVEVEHHLMNTIEGDLQKMFRFVRFCAAGNSQEKRAEHFNGQKKYGAEKQLGQTCGRWWARSEAKLERSERVGADYKEVRLPYDRLVAEDYEACQLYNNSLHPNQKKYPGKTRYEVLMENQNPEAPAIDMAVWAKAVGNRTETSVRRHTLRVNHEQYRLSDPQMIDRFEGGNTECTAYWLKDHNGEVNSVFVYQGDRYICECPKVVRFNEALAEQTEADRAAFVEQEKYISKYRKMVKDGIRDKVKPLYLMDNEQLTMDNEVEIVDVPAVEIPPGDGQSMVGRLTEDLPTWEEDDDELIRAALDKI